MSDGSGQVAETRLGPGEKETGPEKLSSFRRAIEFGKLADEQVFYFSITSRWKFAKKPLTGEGIYKKNYLRLDTGFQGFLDENYGVYAEELI